ncbi:MAG TPA: ankyrin repeat domain-containing protein [Pyrinomonadaceae bacterium]|nr:ankyrin repeat domain-containing protein [Pyrinomonadaceae bacterium]
MLDRTLDHLTILQPCNADWDGMTGNDQIRFCEHCNLHVNDLSSMTRSEAMRLVARSRGRLCVRYVQLPNGGIITSDMPDKLHRIGRRASRLAAGAFTAAISLSNAPAQGRRPGAGGEPNRIVEFVHTVRQRQLLVDDYTGSLSGAIKTLDEAPIADVTVILVDRESGQEQRTSSSSLGTYEFQLLPAGDYLLWARKHGFQTSSNLIHVYPNKRLRQDIVLREQGRYGLMGATAFRVQTDDPLVLAISENDVEKVRALAFTDANLNSPDRSNDRTLLGDAVERGNREIVGLLLAAGAGVNARSGYGQTALMYLTDKATVELVRGLLGAGAKVNARNDFGSDALMRAATFTNPAVLKEILAAGARVDATNQSGETALFDAARANVPDAITLLLDSGAQVDARNEDEETPLLAMAASGDFANFKTLIDRGADIQSSDIYGRKPLMNAAFNEDPRLVKLLIELGADVNAQDGGRSTPIIYAAESGREAIVALLALAGADVDAKDDEGQTALLKAAARGQVECVQALLKAGADITVKDKEGKTALVLAREGKSEDIEGILKFHGARE